MKTLLSLDPTAAARATSALISLLILASIFLKIVPEKLIMPAFGWLAVHLVSHIYLGISDNKIHVCHKCGETLKPCISYKHKCKKK
jgi:hypothetical protein